MVLWGPLSVNMVIWYKMVSWVWWVVASKGYTFLTYPSPKEPSPNTISLGSKTSTSKSGSDTSMPSVIGQWEMPQLCMDFSIESIQSWVFFFPKATLKDIKGKIRIRNAVTLKTVYHKPNTSPVDLIPKCLL